MIRCAPCGLSFIPYPASSICRFRASARSYFPRLRSSSRSCESARISAGIPWREGCKVIYFSFFITILQFFYLQLFWVLLPLHFVERLTPVASCIMVTSLLGSAPSPLRGEGWGEAPLRTLLSYQPSARPSQRGSAAPSK